MYWTILCGNQQCPLKWNALQCNVVQKSFISCLKCNVINWSWNPIWLIKLSMLPCFTIVGWKRRLAQLFKVLYCHQQSRQSVLHCYTLECCIGKIWLASNWKAVGAALSSPPCPQPPPCKKIHAFFDMLLKQLTRWRCRVWFTDCLIHTGNHRMSKYLRYLYF